MSSYGRYTHAIVSRIPASFVDAIGCSDVINLTQARKELEIYVETLRSLGIDVVEMAADESLPDCPFVHDTAVICNGIALLTRPGHPQRAREVDAVRVILKKELRIPILEIMDESASLDGGDVLFTGREFFVGISRRTNESGAKAVADAFPEYPVTPIPIPGKILHLKSCMSMAGPGIIAVSQSVECQEILRKMEREATFKYSTITVPEDVGANVLYVNGKLIHRSEFPSSVQVFDERIDFPKVPLKMWELSKPQASLTSLSLLIRRSKILK